MALRIPNPNSATGNRRRGFTLIECALVTVIVGVGVLAIVSAEMGFHQENDISQRMGTALLLASEVREMTASLPRCDPIFGNATFGPEAGETDATLYNDLDDFAGPNGTGTTINPPLNASRQVIPNMAGWSQVVTVESVLENYVSGPAAPPNTTPVLRMTCKVLYKGPKDAAAKEITRLVWLRSGGG